LGGIWGSGEARKIHWIKWDRICKPKENGGLGIRDLRIFNIALLEKWWWRIRNEKESLWHKVLERKYGNRLEEKKSNSSSW
jgi:hypothetical protein